MAEHKAKDEEQAPAYPAPPMTEADHVASAKHEQEAQKQAAPKVADKKD